MRIINIGALAAAALILSACTTTRQFADTNFRPPQGSFRLIVMQPDISVGVLTAGGAVETNEDWTKQARENVLKALMAQQAGRGGQTKVAATREEAGGDPAAVTDLVALHKAVGTSIQLHKYDGIGLPTKKDRFDWTLGRAAIDFGAATEFDYALFLRAQDTFSSGGRVALQVAGALGCVIGVCVIPAGGQQAAFASLVDLKTGQVVWFNALGSSVGDIRLPEGAQKMVDTLLAKMKPGGPERVSGQPSSRS
jgi:hypothetical protein